MTEPTDADWLNWNEHNDHADGGDNDTAEDEHTANIAQIRSDLAAAIQRATDATAEAAQYLADLRSPRVYDVEFAETLAGPDVEAYLDGTGRALRAAAAMVVMAAR